MKEYGFLQSMQGYGTVSVAMVDVVSLLDGQLMI